MWQHELPEEVKKEIVFSVNNIWSQLQLFLSRFQEQFFSYWSTYRLFCFCYLVEPKLRTNGILKSYQNSLRPNCWASMQQGMAVAWCCYLLKSRLFFLFSFVKHKPNYKGENKVCRKRIMLKCHHTPFSSKIFEEEIFCYYGKEKIQIITAIHIFTRFLRVDVLGFNCSSGTFYVIMFTGLTLF